MHPTGYRISSYGEMITCKPRMTAYADALRDAITPGCRVIDIGAGTGIFAILACHYGAGSVVAIEPNNVIELLPAMARANGCADRITIFKGLSTEFVGPGEADVIISDLRGCLPLFEHHIASIVDARERLLGPSGRLIPARDNLSVALVHYPKGFSTIETPWQHNDVGVDLSAGHPFVVSEWSKAEFDADALLSLPQPLGTLDYMAITDSNFSGSATLKAERAGPAHGLSIWFDAELGAGFGFSNAPGAPPLIYGQTFFPFERAIELGAGDQVELNFRANLVEGAYIYTWTSRIMRQGQPDIQFRQSNFGAAVRSQHDLRHRSGEYVPPLDPRVELDQACLAMIDGTSSLAAIAERLRNQFPGRLASNQAALEHVTDLASRYRDRRGREL